MQSLPDFPWDALLPYRRRAASHADGVCDLAIGTPVDDVPVVVAAALAAHSNTPGYPTTHGTESLRTVIADWLARSFLTDARSPVTPQGILPTIGSKEAIAMLPWVLGLSSNSTVVGPELAYPTYEVGARAVGARFVRADSLTQLGPTRPDLLWINSPSNPTGRVLGVEHMRKVIEWARERSVVVASDECYWELGWDEQPISVLDPAVNEGDLRGVLAFHSLSKRSNLAGYRFGFVAGDPALVAAMLERRKHLGLMVPTPVQYAAEAAFSDSFHVDAQRDRYRHRRELLLDAFRSSGFRVDGSHAGLYLWVTDGRPGWELVADFADRGIIVAPGEFYGPAGFEHVRVSLTASDDTVAAAVGRIAGGGS